MDAVDQNNQTDVKKQLFTAMKCPYCGFHFKEKNPNAPCSCVSCPSCLKTILISTRFKPNPAKVKRRRQLEREAEPSSLFLGVMKSFNSLSRKPRFIVTMVVASIFITAMLARRDSPVAGPSTGSKLPKEESAHSSLCVLRTALELLNRDCRRFPTAEESLRALVRDPGIPGWKGPYIEDLKPDPWQTHYYYALSNGIPLLVSAGPDTVVGTSDDIHAPPPDFSLITGRPSAAAHRETPRDITALLNEALNDSSNAPH